MLAECKSHIREDCTVALPMSDGVRPAQRSGLEAEWL